jgi:hypothetical protein
MYCFLSGGVKHGGGAQTIQVLLIEELSKRSEICKLFDVAGGSVYNELVDRNVKFEFVEIELNKNINYSHFLSNDDLLIVFDSNLWSNLYYFRNANCKVLIWEIFYPWVERFVNLRLLPSKQIINILEKDILFEIYKHKAFFFIDYMGKELFEKRIGKPVDWEAFLPIPIKLETTFINRKINETDLIISYVGRSVNWKIYPFVKIYNDLVEVYIKNNIIFNVVCDNKDIFSNIVQKNCKFTNNARIEYFENLSLKKLNNLLLKSDLHFAMGTAALDGAKLGIPTILIDACEYPLPKNYKYRWIYQTNNLVLGKIINEKFNIFDGKMTMKNILNDIESNYLGISNSSYQYVKENHDVTTITNKIIKYSKHATLTLSTLSSKFLSRYIYILKSRKIESRINNLIRLFK